MHTELAWPAEMLPADDRARLARYDEALAFFDGNQWIHRRHPGEVRLTLNYARVLLRKVASYVFPAEARFSIAVDGDQQIANRAERLLAETLAYNRLGELDSELCVAASVRGDAAVKVTWDTRSGSAVVATVDPATLMVEAAPDDPRRIVSAMQCYGLTGQEIATVFEVDPVRLSFDPGRRYRIIERWTDAEWMVTVAGQPLLRQPNPYGWIPYVILANHPGLTGIWGESDLADLYDVCREINRRMSVLSQVLELSGAPIAVLENVDGSEGIAVGPGAKWELPEGSRAYLLDLLGNGGVSLHLDYVGQLFRVLHDVSETPRTAFGDSGRTISGAALEVEIQPLLQKVARKRRQWDAFYQQRNWRLLDLLDRFGGAEIGGLRRTTTIWPTILPSDTELAVRSAVALVESGIQSRRTALAT
ncbi:MAG: phage portal protein, partial [Thermomicrobiales bacterium]|nr:phage portal protein [Thermomicrobiales bacterium]